MEQKLHIAKVLFYAVLQLTHSNLLRCFRLGKVGKSVNNTNAVSEAVLSEQTASEADWGNEKREP